VRSRQKGDEEGVKMNVKVHRNLNKLVWSITVKGRVVQHVPTFALAGARFVVQEGGRQRVLRERCRLVHAYVTGETTEGAAPEGLAQVRYNPYRAGYFHTNAGVPVLCAAYVEFRADGTAWASAAEQA
jgi:hypothetical protein